MRVIKFLFTSLFFLLVVAVMTFFTGRELLMYLATENIERTLVQLQSSNRSGQYVGNCMDMGTYNSDLKQLLKLQLRFIDDRHYVTEAICPQRPSQPIEIDQGELPPLVKKEAGSSGLVWGDKLSGFVLSVAGKSKSFIVESADYFIDNVEDDSQVNMGISPQSECLSFGFSCCDEFSEQGVGSQISSVTDCVKSCYSSCRNRPLVLSFTTQPFMDKQNRTLEVAKNQEIAFYYNVSGTERDLFDGQGNGYVQVAEAMIDELMRYFNQRQKKPSHNGGLKVNLNYGDGSSKSFSELQGHIIHSYSCSKPSCSYIATLEVVDQNLESVASPLSKITIIVK